MSNTQQELAKIGYEAYAASIGVTREPTLAEWHKLPKQIQVAWTEAAEAILKQALLSYDLSLYVDPT